MMGWTNSTETCWASLRSSHISLVNPALTDSSKVTGLGLFTGQIGYAWNAALLYLKGGAALTNNSLLQATTVGGVGLNFATSSRWGGSIGVGFEYGFTPNWTAGIEYDHLMMGNAVGGHQHHQTFSIKQPKGRRSGGAAGTWCR